MADPKKPFVAIVGGSKVSTKITVVESLMSKAQKIIIGGGMIFTFFKARGLNVSCTSSCTSPNCLANAKWKLSRVGMWLSLVLLQREQDSREQVSSPHRCSCLKPYINATQVGSSLVEDDKLELAKKLEAMAKEKGVELLLPTDVVMADKFAADANTKVRITK